MDSRLTTIREKLTEWYKHNGRDFPWRKDATPYNIMVAEILLQQTFARKVAPVFREITRRYPTVRDLALASLPEVEQIIKPLGLLYRGKVLVEASRQIVDEFGGNFPQTEEELLKIKGVGHYVSSAILCYSFGQRLVPVDTNVERVICRVFGLEYPVRASKTKNEVRRLCGRLASSADDARSLNYAMLDFAADTCGFYKPQCQDCMLCHICDYARSKANNQKFAKVVRGRRG